MVMPFDNDAHVDIVRTIRKPAIPPSTKVLKPEKKKREKLSALCKTPPSTIKAKGRHLKRGTCLGEVCII